MLEADILQRFIFPEAEIRGVIVRLHGSYRAAYSRHPYPLVLKQLLGEALSAAALLSSTIKIAGSLIIQAQCEEPIKLLIAQADHQFHVRGLIKWDQATDIDAAEFALKQGQLAITIQPQEGKRYQGVVPLNGGSLAACLERYFEQSVQLPTRLYLCADEEYAAGLLLQAMPTEDATQQQQLWETLMHLTATLTPAELLSIQNQALLKLLYHEEDIMLFPTEPVSFQCSCSHERSEQALLLTGYQELSDILKTEPVISLTCEFCNQQYDFGKADIETLFADVKKAPPLN